MYSGRRVGCHKRYFSTSGSSAGLPAALNSRERSKAKRCSVIAIAMRDQVAEQAGVVGRPGLGLGQPAQHAGAVHASLVADVGVEVA